MALYVYLLLESGKKMQKFWTAEEEKLKVVVCAHIESSPAAERRIGYIVVFFIARILEMTSIEDDPRQILRQKVRDLKSKIQFERLSE